MKYIRILIISTVLLLSVQSDDTVFNQDIVNQITISFDDNLFNGHDVKSILEKSRLNYSPNETNLLMLKNVSTDKIFKNASFDAFVNLEELIIIDSQINNFPEATFERLQKLNALKLSNIRLRSVCANLFKFMPILQILHLNSNNLEDLPADVFKNQNRIGEIYLGGNHLKTLPKGIFQRGVLRNLYLENNDITTLEDVFQPNKYLEHLDLSFNKVSHIDKNTFKNLPALHSINVSNTFTIEVESLPKELFSDSTNLHNIRMDKNHLKSLEVGIFHNLPNLIELDISSNMLTNLAGEMFKNNIHLRRLNLSNNELQYLDKYMFTNLIELLEVDLSNNKLTNLDAEIFFKLTNLSAFYISHNKVDLAVAGSDFSILQKCLNLTKIQAKNNSISNVFTDWCNNSKLEELDLTFNPLPLTEQINVKFKSPILFHFTSNDSTNVRFVVKSRTSISSHSDKILILDRNQNCERSGCSCKIHLSNALKKITLKCLRFNEDDLQKWPFDIINEFVHGKHYKVEFKLANCGLTSLHPVNKYVKEVREAVTKLVLSGNNLKYLNGLEEDLPALKELNIDRNNFTTFDQTAVQFLMRSKNLTNVTLHQNPWMCDCSLKHFYDFIKNDENDENKINRRDEITCSNMNNKPISQLQFEEDFCPPDRRALYVVIISFAMFAFVCFSLMYYYYTNEMKVKVWIFSKPFLRFLVTEKEVDRHKKYDAFISYATPDEWFVDDELVPKLETGERPYKLCIHQRDWLGGDYIPNQIDRSVEESRRTIIVMSPNFLKSFWGKKEFQSAYLKSMQERCPRILIILLEQIDKTKLDEEMKAYISTNTYLEWKDPWFWQKLRYALPHTYRIRCKRTQEEMLIP